MVLYIMLRQLLETFELVNKIMRCDHSNEKLLAVLPMKLFLFHYYTADFFHEEFALY